MLKYKITEVKEYEDMLVVQFTWQFSSTPLQVQNSIVQIDKELNDCLFFYKTNKSWSVNFDYPTIRFNSDYVELCLHLVNLIQTPQFAILYRNYTSD